MNGSGGLGSGFVCALLCVSVFDSGFDFSVFGWFVLAVSVTLFDSVFGATELVAGCDDCNGCDPL